METTEQASASGETGESHVVPAGVREGEWSTFNILSLDGGGIRGYWTLLALERLFYYISEEEKQYEIYHSFHPESWPEKVSQVPPTEEEKLKSKAVHNQEQDLQSLEPSRRFLPCHYFNYICGSSTGALIAIMLGRFRMTILDCLFEYRILGEEVFGKPRMFSTMKYGVGHRPKYKAKNLEKVFKDVCIRRNEKPGPTETGKITFVSGRELCDTFVTTMKSEDDGRLTEPHLIRSYDHNKRNPPDHSRGVTLIPTTFSSRANTNASIDSDAFPRRRVQKKNLVGTDYGKASQLEVWEVARAATAADFYFEPFKIENARDPGKFTEYTDGGFSPANNPTRKGKEEIEDLRGYSSIGIIVSVGTARKRKEDAKKASFFSAIPDKAREFADKVTDPEETHRLMQRDYDTQNQRQGERQNNFEYFRLNHPRGLETELDEWEPKRTMFNRTTGGSKTIQNIETAFKEWSADPDNTKDLQKCAAELVACRRRRASTSRWERYATGAVYDCRFQCCDSREFFDRRNFESHLIGHGIQDSSLETEMRDCRKHWRYQANDSSNPG